MYVFQRIAESYEGPPRDHLIQAPAQAGSATADHQFQCCLFYKQNQTLLILESAAWLDKGEYIKKGHQELNLL